MSKQQYDDCVISFVDILGFSNLVLDNDFDRVRSIVGFLKWQLESEQVQIRNPSGSKLTDREVVSQKSVFFSDNVVVISHFDQDARAQKIVECISKVKMAQLKLASKGIWIRGGVCIGPIFHKRYQNVTTNDDMIFGPGLVEAYRLESKIAKFPRIIVEQKIADEIFSSELLFYNHHDDVTESFAGSKLLSKDKDGEYFIDFLSRKPMLFNIIEDIHFGLGGPSTNSLNEIMTPGSEYQNQLFDNAVEKFKVEIEKALSRNEMNKDVREKIEWLEIYASNYQN